MDDIVRGKHILTVAKGLKPFRQGDFKIVAFLHASSYAGRMGLLASALRHNESLNGARLHLLGAEEGFSPPELRDRVLPRMQEAGLCRIRQLENGEIQSVDGLVLGYDGILTGVSRFYEESEPTLADRGTLLTLDAVSEIPRFESEVMAIVAKEVGEEDAKTALDLAKGYRLVGVREGKGLPDPLLFGQKIWSKNINKIGKALVSLNREQRQTISEFLARVRAHQGIPEAILRRFAAELDSEYLLDLAINIGLLDRTEIETGTAQRRPFLTSPHFYGDAGDDLGEDRFDRIKIFLDSIRHGQHYGDPWTGRIFSPSALLRKFLNTGELGPCTAIGQDYVMSEKAGIIKVHRAETSRRYVMELVQTDTVQKVYDVVTAGVIEEEAPMEASTMTDGRRFRSIEESRAEMGEVPERMAEAERAIITTLRES